MKLEFNSKKWIWTKETDVTSAWFIFDYSNIDDINKLDELTKIKIWDEIYNCIISNWIAKPISIETEQWTHKYKQWEADATLNNVEECSVKLDLFINDAISWLIRVESLSIKSSENSAE